MNGEWHTYECDGDFDATTTLEDLAARYSHHFVNRLQRAPPLDRDDVHMMELSMPALRVSFIVAWNLVAGVFVPDPPYCNDSHTEYEWDDKVLDAVRHASEARRSHEAWIAARVAQRTAPNA